MAPECLAQHEMSCIACSKPALALCRGHANLFLLWLRLLTVVLTAAGTIQQGKQEDAAGEAADAAAKPIAPVNPEEMELDLDEADEAEEASPAAATAVASPPREFKLQEKAVPAAVFGSAGGTEQDTLGALDRFKKRKT